jgi:hypothetical protein
MANTAIRTAGRVLNPDRPIMALAELARCPRSTAKSWATGHRRPPVDRLKLVHGLLVSRIALATRTASELVSEITRRERERPQRSGFHEVRSRDGAGSPPRDGRNRLGHPRRHAIREA